MKNRLFVLGIALLFLGEVITLILFAVRTPDFSQDAVAVNEIVRTVTDDFESMQEHKNMTALDYVVIDNDGGVIYKTRSGLSESINAAIAHRDTVLDIIVDDRVTGKVIIYNDGAEILRAHRRTAVAVLLAVIAVQSVICIGYAAYMHLSIVKPFRKLKGFAERVAGGDLDIPLEMDRYNLFGAFTESFDIMRSELKQARIAEAQAQQSKKELVAKLSHDIKTPIASVKAVSEIGLAVTDNEKDKQNYSQIIGKSDQINTLVTNLFTATLEELQQLPVMPMDIESAQIKSMLEKADYFRRATIPDIPDCMIYADALRLQQVFDNIFSNAYKYAKTDIAVTARKTDEYIEISIEDHGGGVEAGDLPMLKEKYKRGRNAENVEGAGLGLYISDHFMKNMCGRLDIRNGTQGLDVVVSIRLSGTV